MENSLHNIDTDKEVNIFLDNQNKELELINNLLANVTIEDFFQPANNEVSEFAKECGFKSKYDINKQVKGLLELITYNKLTNSFHLDVADVPDCLKQNA